jgi:CobQ/CobB/MinD/ParA nucleotide binding domain
MRTITFYSYKGGVGRSLLVANAARYLSILGKSVVALDFDLEAPGLHYKFELGSESARTEPSRGIVDILTDFLEIGTLPPSLSDYTTELPVAKDSGPIRIMRAGTAPLGDYWRKLSKINWSDLFYSSEPIGTQFFLELQERIHRDFNPDFCLIDARAGITDMGGVATTLLPDTVVCLALDSTEHLEGLRAMMQGVQQTTLKQGTTVNLVPVISRLVVRRDHAIEHQQLDRIRSFLNQPIKEDAPSLDLTEVITLHSEPVLDSQEQLLVGGKNSPHELPLLRDYLRLFSKIIPAEEIRPHVGQLIQSAIGRLLDDPDGAQSDLEALTTYCADREAYRALLKLYQVRKAPLEKSIATAAVMWQLHASGTVPEPLLVDVVKAAYSEPRATEFQKKYVDFAEDVWRSSGLEDIRILINIANSYLPERRERAVRVLSGYIDKAESPRVTAIVRLLDLLRSGRSFVPAFSTIEKFKMTVDAPEFHAAWARLLVDQNDLLKAQEALQDTAFRSEAVRSEDPATLFRLLKLAGTDMPGSLLKEALEVAITKHDFPQLQDLAELFQEEGHFDEFEARVRGRLPDGFIEEVTQGFQRRNRRYRMFK